MHSTPHTRILTPDLAGVFLLEIIDGLGSEEDRGRKGEGGRGGEERGGGEGKNE